MKNRIGDRRWFSVFIACGSLACSIACNNQPQPAKPLPETLQAEAYQNQQHGFSMHFPKGFQQAEPVAGSGTTVVLCKDESGLANMNLQIGPTGDETLTKVFQDIQQGLPTMAPGSTVHGDGHTKINNQPARWIELSHSAGGNDVRVIVYILVSKQRYIMIFCTAESGSFETHRAAFRDSAESLKTHP